MKVRENVPPSPSPVPPPLRTSWLGLPAITRITAPEGQVVVLCRNGVALEILPTSPHPRYFLTGGWSAISIPHARPFLSDDTPGFDALIAKPWFKSRVRDVIDLGTMRRAVVREGGRPRAILGPGRHAWIESPRSCEVHTHHLGESPRLDAPDADAILALPEAASLLELVEVGAGHRCILWRAGAAIAFLPPGRHLIWKAEGDLVRSSMQDTVPVLAEALTPALDTPDGAKLLEEVTLGPNERASVWLDGKTVLLLGPGRRAVWRDPRVRVERHDILATPAVPPETAGAILASPDSAKFLDRVEVNPGHRCILWQSGRAVAFLGPGRHVYWKSEAEFSKTTVADAQPLLPEQFTAALDSPGAAEHLEEVVLESNERAVLWVEGKVSALLGPGRRAFWKSSDRIRLERFVAEQIEFAHPRLAQIGEAPGAEKLLHVHMVPTGGVGLLFVDGKYRRTLEPGRHAFWLGIEPHEVEIHDLRPRTISLQGQELLTQDRVSLRLNFDMTVRTSDPLKARMGATQAEATLYNRAQLALREFVGARTLDQLLERKDDLGEEVLKEIASAAASVGHEVVFAGLRDVILPGELRAILNRVIEAKKRAEANVIKRREETASTRSLLNTAKVIEENPIMMRLKEIEALQEMMEKVGSLTVFDGIRGLLDSVRLGDGARLGEGGRLGEAGRGGGGEARATQSDAGAEAAEGPEGV